MFSDRILGVRYLTFSGDSHKNGLRSGLIQPPLAYPNTRLQSCL